MLPQDTHREPALISVLIASPQSQSAIEAARKDLGEYVSQAQKGLNEQFATLSANSSTPAAEGDTPAEGTSSSRDLVDTTTPDGESSATSSASASTATLPDPQQDASSQTLFTRLQSSLPPDLLTTLRETIPDSVRDAQRRQELAQAAQARVHGAAARGEVLLRGASIFLRDAVRVVPPEEYPASASTPPTFEDATTPRAEAPSPVGISGTPATRRDALLRALRATPAILRIDPAKEERSVAFFGSWILQTKSLPGQTQREAELSADEGALQVTRSTLGQLSPLLTL